MINEIETVVDIIPGREGKRCKIGAVGSDVAFLLLLLLLLLQKHVLFGASEVTLG